MSNLRKGSMAIGSTVIIGFVIVSFMFTGYQGFSTSSDTVAVVDGTPIKVDEFRNEYQRQVQFYSQFFGGKNLTPQQIKQFGVENAALKNLIGRKLIYNLAEDADFAAGKNELAEVIKKQPYFQTDNNFDVNKYKALLAANNFTPSQYEELMGTDLKISKANQILSNYFVSENFAKELVQIKKNQLEIAGIKLSKDSLQKYVDVTQSEISAFLENKENEEQISSLFESRKPSLTRPEEVQASHILISAKEGTFDEALAKIKKIKSQINTANFATLANKHTEDPTGKKKGGDLGWFGKGKMVPEFENIAFSSKPGTISGPVKTEYGYHLIYVKNKKAAFEPKLELYKNDLAKELIQRTKKQEHKELIAQLDNEITTALGANDFKKIETLKNKYGFEFKQSHLLSRIGSQGLTLGITNELVDKLYKSFSGTPVVEKIDTATYITFVKAKKLVENISINTESELKSQNSLFASRFRKEAMEKLEKNANIKTFVKF
jgi:peptidyl-prolyl cis-trans isomerase D